MQSELVGEMCQLLERSDAGLIPRFMSAVYVFIYLALHSVYLAVEAIGFFIQHIKGCIQKEQVVELNQQSCSPCAPVDKHVSPSKQPLLVPRSFNQGDVVCCDDLSFKQD